MAGQRVGGAGEGVRWILFCGPGAVWALAIDEEGDAAVDGRLSARPVIGCAQQPHEGPGCEEDRAGVASV